MVERKFTDDNQVDYTRAKLTFVALVGASGGLIALQGDASLPAISAATVFGLVVGVALLRYLYWSAR